jgi:hypothetical protein
VFNISKIILKYFPTFEKGGKVLRRNIFAELLFKRVQKKGEPASPNGGFPSVEKSQSITHDTRHTG